ncbi:hypothetical protein PPIS_a3489 [Pseudoalteromonas piscicida]|uniref:Uncharacterized protein n=1 Tax=Pseudoalteromonas piscicida TaxID=43662 RepID=A0ABM6NHA9_PSEO7|nr:hypothetical protein PPIS_a3489 [Pseudoalteromonas piscicida]
MSKYKSILLNDKVTGDLYKCRLIKIKLTTRFDVLQKY